MRSALLVVVMILAGCGSAPAEQHNSTDVMFLQMSLEYIAQGDRVAEPSAQRAGDARVRVLTAELHEQWARESTQMRGWLGDWKQPVEADPDTGVHAGHGDLHSLRASDIAELTAAKGDDFDRTAVNMLLGHLHNVVQVARMEATGGRDPRAKALAEAMTATRQEQIRRLLTLQAAATMGS
ncbi:DUF305 domain-containing protein [Winogradskya humida]|nr:DUF305 domain-containing protein [Actinoplanes humidus]